MTGAKRQFSWKRWQTPILFGFIVLLSFLTYFHRYWQPKAVFWDENYHIASAQKYLHRVYFMEQHPPLGKLLVALGETIIRPNEKTDQFLDTDYGTTFDENFSFVGYRFFSAFLSWWAAPLVFLIFLVLLRNSLHAALMSFFYVFDNALIVHTRGAMLEGPLMFFVAAMLLAFVLILRDHANRRRLILWSVLLGTAFGLALTTKVLSLIFLLLGPPILWAMWPHWRRMVTCILASGIPFVLVYCAVWQTHFALGQYVNPALPDDGYYQASEPYKFYLDTNQAGSLRAFPVMLKDSWHFVSHYNGGAPRLDLCKADENGSPVYFWPFGGRTINYRWETPDGGAYRYLYLIPNPAGWALALLGLVTGTSMLIASVLFPPKKPLKQKFLLTVFLGLYFAYMLAVSRIDRVLYLYHYFIPLLLSFIIFGLVFDEIQTIGRKVLTEYGKTVVALVVAAVIFLSHQYYRGFTYYEPLTDAQVNRRNIFSLWELHCVNCPQVSGLVIPRGNP